MKKNLFKIFIAIYLVILLISFFVYGISGRCYRNQIASFIIHFSLASSFIFGFFFSIRYLYLLTIKNKDESIRIKTEKNIIRARTFFYIAFGIIVAIIMATSMQTTISCPWEVPF
ncbi:MAG: hypothetical protein WA055_00405 [Candidatus Moraniibacteriota bacterium]